MKRLSISEEERHKKRLAASVVWAKRIPEYTRRKGREWKAANAAQVKAINKAWYEANKERASIASKKWLKEHPGYNTWYGLAAREKLAGRKRPKKCDVCKGAKKISFDHCHSTKLFRGWLCHGCNIALGFARNNPKILRKLADYQEAHITKHKLKKKGPTK
jgi:hypothetical protein